MSAGKFYGGVHVSRKDQQMCSTVEEDQPPAEDGSPIGDGSFKRGCYAVRYRFRWFSSKGAFVVLVWTLLVSAAFGSLDNLFTGFLDVFEHRDDITSYVVFLPYFPWFLFALLSGWLADTKIGNHKMVRTGVLLYFAAAVLTCILHLSLETRIDNKHVLPLCLLTLIRCIGFAGRAMILVTSVQLGLDQMPDASSTNVTSFITWFVACLYAGNWIFSFFQRLVLDCFGAGSDQLVSYNQILSLFPIIPLCILLCSDFLLPKELFTKDSKCPQSSKTIVDVLKFAKQHKVPVNRSALTYWEESLPSRLDLGKSRYGGPFTTEQVEDVKTVLRLVALTLPLGFIFTSFYLFQQFVYVKDIETTIFPNHSCTTDMVRLFTYETSLWVVGGIAIYEFAIYPLAVPIIPSIVKRIGATSFITILVNVISVVFSVTDYYREYTDPGDTDWFWILQSLVSAPLKIMLLTSAIEFICAQSPYNMKGLAIGYIWSEYYASNIIANILAGIMHTVCSGPYCSVVYSGTATVWSIAGFILYCILARWYKRRKRDDISTPHRWVEDAYEKYLVNSDVND